MYSWNNLKGRNAFFLDNLFNTKDVKYGKSILAIKDKTMKSTCLLASILNSSDLKSLMFIKISYCLMICLKFFFFSVKSNIGLLTKKSFNQLIGTETNLSTMKYVRCLQIGTFF